MDQKFKKIISKEIPFTDDEVMVIAKEQAMFCKKENCSALSADIMEDLRDSVYYTILNGMESTEYSEELHATDTFLLGQKVIVEKTEKAKEIYLMAAISDHGIPHRPYHRSLRAMGSFYRHYKPMLFAHHVPKNIEYPLFSPIPEQYLGIDHMIKWLQQVILENMLIRCFSKEEVTMLLRRCVPDFEKTNINICEPVIINAAGRVLANKDLTSLHISEKDRKVIDKRFESLSEEKCIESLEKAAFILCKKLGINQEDAAEKIKKVIISNYPRYKEAVKNHPTEKVFLPFSEHHN